MVEDPVLDAAYAALANPTRRALLVALRHGEARITDLAAELPMTFAGVARHVAVLEDAGYRTLNDIIDLEREDFLKLPGIAPEEADRIMAMIDEIDEFAKG